MITQILNLISDLVVCILTSIYQKGITTFLFAILVISNVHGQNSFISGVTERISNDTLTNSCNNNKHNNKHNNFTYIPFDYNNRLIKLNIGINSSQKNHEFILDSGAPTFISDSLVNVYDLPYLNSETVFDVNGNTQKMDFYNIRSIEIGGKQFKGIETASNGQVANMPILKGHQYAGLLGANAMRNSIWQINYNCREITLTDKSENLTLPDSTHQVKMKLDELSRPVITVIIAGKYKVDCIVDVAYNGSLLLPDRFFSKPIFNDSMSYSKQEMYSAGFETKIKQMEYKYLQNISIGNMKLENVKASASGSNNIALVGNEFLEKYTIVMNFVDKSMAFLLVEEQCNILCC